MSSTEELRDKVATLLSDDYACTRVWEAWQIGTMSEDDFILLSETERVDEVVELVANQINEVLDRLKTPTVQDVFPSKPYDGPNTYKDMKRVVEYYDGLIEVERQNVLKGLVSKEE